MSYLLVLLMVLVASLIGWLALRPVSLRAEMPRGPRIVSVLGAERPGSEREVLTKRLQELSVQPAPTDLKPGAMCYKPAGPPEQTEYVCPACKEKTLYANVVVVAVLQRDLEACRRLVKEIKGLKVELDESRFCRKCHPEVKDPKLGLVVRYPGQPEPHRVWGVTSDDLRLIAEFLSGKNKHVSANEGETPIKDHLKRLEELLGVKPGSSPSN